MTTNEPTRWCGLHLPSTCSATSRATQKTRRRTTARNENSTDEKWQTLTCPQLSVGQTSPLDCFVLFCTAKRLHATFALYDHCRNKHIKVPENPLHSQLKLATVFKFTLSICLVLAEVPLRLIPPLEQESLYSAFPLCVSWVARRSPSPRPPRLLSDCKLPFPKLSICKRATTQFNKCFQVNK